MYVAGLSFDSSATVRTRTTLSTDFKFKPLESSEICHTKQQRNRDKDHHNHCYDGSTTDAMARLSNTAICTLAPSESAQYFLLRWRVGGENSTAAIKSSSSRTTATEKVSPWHVRDWKTSGEGKVRTSVSGKGTVNRLCVCPEGAS